MNDKAEIDKFNLIGQLLRELAVAAQGGKLHMIREQLDGDPTCIQWRIQMVMPLGDVPKCLDYSKPVLEITNVDAEGKQTVETLDARGMIGAGATRVG